MGHLNSDWGFNLTNSLTSRALPKGVEHKPNVSAS
jgi:hypothetical protein